MKKTHIAVLGAGVLLAAALLQWVVPAWAAVTLRAGSPLQAVAWSPDGRQLAAGANDGLVRVCDVGRWQPAATLDTQFLWVHCLAFSPDGRLLAAGNFRGLQLWDVQSGAIVHEWPGGEGHVDVWSVAFSPDGQRVAQGDVYGTARMHDVATGEALSWAAGGSSRIRAVAFSPDGALLASANWDSQVHLWHTGSGEPAQPPIPAMHRSSPSAPTGSRSSSSGATRAYASGTWRRPANVSPGRQAALSTRSRSAPTGALSPRATATTRCACGMRPRASCGAASAPGGSTSSTTASGAWPSAPTGGASPPAGTTAACACGR